MYSSVSDVDVDDDDDDVLLDVSSPPSDSDDCKAACFFFGMVQMSRDANPAAAVAASQ